MTKGFTIVGAAILIGVWFSCPVSANTPITHSLLELHQAYALSCECPPVKFAGFAGALPADQCAIAGFFDIDPGSTDWSNFVTAAQESQAYYIKNVLLEKRTPEVVQCADKFPSHVVRQTTTGNIRLRWPLMYEAPGTVWTLTITYGTPTAVQLPGEPAPSYVHQDVWTWVLQVTVDDIKTLLVVLRQLPFGMDEVPLLSDESLYVELQAKLDAVNAAIAMGETATAAAWLTEFELEVMDACIYVSPGEPWRGGPGTGIANTDENPACCKLLLDAESLLVGSAPPERLEIAALSAQPSVLWPTDDSMVPVYVNYEVLGEGPLRRQITSITANEPIKQPDYRGLNGDYRIFSPEKVYLRRSRSDQWRDRVYTITVTVTDSRGNEAAGKVEVNVPRLLLRF